MTVSKSDGFPSLVTHNQDHLRWIGLPLGGISWTLFLVIMAVTVVQFWGGRRWVHYE